MKIVQNFQGSYFGVKNLSSVADTDWHDLKSEDFKDSLTGDQLPAGLAFFDIAIMSSPFNDGNTTNSFFKMRAKTLANDPIDDEIEIPESGGFATNLSGFKNGAVTTVAYKKGAGGISLVFQASFEIV
jgi:hypothetical protein